MVNLVFGIIIYYYGIGIVGDCMDGLDFFSGVDDLGDLDRGFGLVGLNVGLGFRLLGFRIVGCWILVAG